MVAYIQGQNAEETSFKACMLKTSKSEVQHLHTTKELLSRPWSLRSGSLLSCSCITSLALLMLDKLEGQPRQDADPHKEALHQSL